MDALNNLGIFIVAMGAGNACVATITTLALGNNKTRLPGTVVAIFVLSALLVLTGLAIIIYVAQHI